MVINYSGAKYPALSDDATIRDLISKVQVHNDGDALLKIMAASEMYMARSASTCKDPEDRLSDFRTALIDYVQKYDLGDPRPYMERLSNLIGSVKKEQYRIDRLIPQSPDDSHVLSLLKGSPVKESANKWTDEDYQTAAEYVSEHWRPTTAKHIAEVIKRQYTIGSLDSASDYPTAKTCMSCEDREMLLCIYSAIDELPVKQKECLYCFISEGTFRKAGKILHIDHETVKAHFDKSISSICEYLIERGYNLDTDNPTSF